jgi:hypothetical protein
MMYLRGHVLKYMKWIKIKNPEYSNELNEVNNVTE